MAETTNLMSIAPVQPKVSTKMTSQSTQPKYKSATRTGKKSFGATLDKINAKLDELNQSVKDLQNIDKENVQVDPDAEKNDTAEKIPAQGKSDSPQDAPEKAISNEESETRNDSKAVAKEDGKPADIFLGEKQVSNDFNAAPKISAQNPVAEKISDTPDETSELVNDQTTTNILAANSMAYLFGMNSESLLITKSVTDSAAVEVSKVEGVQEISSTQNLQTLLPQSDNKNAQSMLQMLGGKTWRVFDNQPTIQTSQPVENQPVQVQTSQPIMQLVESQPAQVQTPQPIMQLVESQPAQVQTPQPIIQPVENQPAQVQTPQPIIQPVENQPVQVQTSQPITQPIESQPVQVQTSQPITQPIESQPVQVQIPQPIIQPAESQPVQVQTSQPIAQPVENQPVQVQTPQPTAQPAENQPVQVQTPQPTAQPAENQPVQIQTAQLTAQPVENQPVQVQTPQPTAQPAENQPVQVQTAQPIAQPVENQPAQIQTAQPTAQPAENQPVQVQTAQPIAQLVENQPVQVQTPQPIIQPAESPPVQIQTAQPIAQLVKNQPAQIQTPQPIIQPAENQPVQVQTPQPIIQPAENQPVQVQTSQPTAQTLQNFSELLGTDIQVEEAPTAAPVTSPQATPQQFAQDNQRQGEQNFQNQIFQTVANNDLQAQPVSTGGEVFAANLAVANDTPQTQQATPTQAPDAPPPMPQEDFNVPAQIVRQARLIRAAENTEMVIKLNPEHLGELTLRVSVSQNGAVNASFHSDNAQVRTIIENSLVQLRHELNNVGLKVENVQVYAGLSDGGGLMNGQGGQAWQQNRQQSSGNRTIDLNSLERDVEATAPVNESSDVTGVDYSV